MLQKIKVIHDLFSNLASHAELMRIVLDKSSNSNEASQGTRKLISVQHTEISKPNRKLLVSSLLVGEHKAMAWAVHWLGSKSLVFGLEHEHVLLVVGVVARSLEEFEIKEVW